ncbi:MAG: YMGG-like glycine zipper-containing protein [Gemmatimonadaceae bacterium]
MRNRMFVLLLPAALLAGACRGDNRAAKTDPALNNDLQLAGQSGYRPLDTVSALEQSRALQQQQLRAGAQPVGTAPRAQRPVVRRSSSSGQATSGSSAGQSTGGEVYTEKHTQRDAAIGAAAGAVIGATTSSNKVQGGLIGAAVGGVLGGVVGNNVDVKKKRRPPPSE